MTVTSMRPRTQTMEAVVVSGPGSYTVRDDIPVPVPERDEVLCRVKAVTICGTDIHIIGGDFPGFWPTSYPFIPGHEWAGEVVGVGGEAELLGWRAGDRVAGTSHAPCGYCPTCVEGRYNICENYGRAGLHAQYGHNTQGAYAAYVVHSVRSVFRIPDGLPFDDGSILDPAAIALHAARRSGVGAGDTVVITGAGVMGLLAADCARALGAGRVIIAGRGARLEKAAELGHEVLDISEADLISRLSDLTGGLGPDAVIECTGDADVFQRGIKALRRGGVMSVVGIPLSEPAIDARRVVLDEVEIRGVRASAGEMRNIIPLVTSGRIRVGELITHRFPLSAFDEAFTTFRSRRDGALKVILYP
jgi:L-iditol 2-dehydrogenase